MRIGEGTDQSLNGERAAKLTEGNGGAQANDPSGVVDHFGKHRQSNFGFSMGQRASGRGAQLGAFVTGHLDDVGFERRRGDFAQDAAENFAKLAFGAGQVGKQQTRALAAAVDERVFERQSRYDQADLTNPAEYFFCGRGKTGATEATKRGHTGFGVTIAKAFLERWDSFRGAGPAQGDESFSAPPAFVFLSFVNLLAEKPAFAQEAKNSGGLHGRRSLERVQGQRFDHLPVERISPPIVKANRAGDEFGPEFLEMERARVTTGEISAAIGTPDQNESQQDGVTDKCGDDRLDDNPGRAQPLNELKNEFHS